LFGGYGSEQEFVAKTGFDKFLNLAREKGSRHQQSYDQTVLNYLMHGRVRFLDETWSWNHWRFEEMPNAPVILHFIAKGKPWLAPHGEGGRGLWLEAFRKLCSKSMPGTYLRLLLVSKFNRLKQSANRHEMGGQESQRRSRRPLTGEFAKCPSASRPGCGFWNLRSPRVPLTSTFMIFTIFISRVASSRLATVLDIPEWQLEAPAQSSRPRMTAETTSQHLPFGVAAPRTINGGNQPG